MPKRHLNAQQKLALNPTLNPDGTLTRPASPFKSLSQAVAGTGGPKKRFNLKLHGHRSRPEHYVIVVAIDHTYYHGSYSAYCTLSKHKGPVPMPCSKDELYLDGAFHFTKPQVKKITKDEKAHGLNGKDTVIEVGKIKSTLA